jgi:hypothetical protein
MDFETQEDGTGMATPPRVLYHHHSCILKEALRHYMQ